MVTLDSSDSIDFLGNEDEIPPENDCGSSDDSEEEDVTEHQNFIWLKWKEYSVTSLQTKKRIVIMQEIVYS